MTAKKLHQMPVSIDPSNIEEIRSYPIREVSHWLNFHYDELYTEIISRLRLVAADCPLDKIKKDQRFSTDICTFAAKKFVNTTRQRLPVIAMLPLFSTWSGKSCNELVFNRTATVELSGVAKGYIEYYRSLSGARKKQILDTLREHQADARNPLWTLKKRCTELANLHGKSLDEYLLLYFSYCNNSRSRSNFLEYDVQTEAHLSNRTEYALNVIMLWIVLMTGFGSDISADYLLVQDYSNLATINGVELTGEEKAALSIFLGASDLGQEKAAQLFYWFSIRPEQK